MTRFKPVAENELSVAQAEMAAKAGRSGPYHAFMYAPEMWLALQSTRQYLTSLSALDKASREAAMLVIASHWDCDPAIDAHITLAREAGLGDQIIEAIVKNIATPENGDKTEIIVACCKALLQNHSIHDALFNQARQIFGERGVVELISLVGFFTTICLVLNTMESDADKIRSEKTVKIDGKLVTR